MIFITINGKPFFFKSRLSILEACKLVGIKIPRFCYSETLSIAGNCRMCLVEISTSLKPVVACATEILAGMTISTNSPFILKARENILEMLLLNHPLDCPICDQAGECDLQDQAAFYGTNFGRNYLNRRGVEKKNCGPFIKTIMTRCIHCTRCVRFGEEICGLKFFGVLSRSRNSEIGNYLIKLASSELSANVIDLCPVGALTLKSIPFQIRPWEIYSIESIDLTDSLGSNIYLTFKGTDILRVIPKKNILINTSWISNKARFYYNISSFFFNNSQFYKNNFFSLPYIKLPLLFLISPNLDLKTLLTLKKLSANSKDKLNTKITSLTKKVTNFYFWGNKNKINDLTLNQNSICFLISVDLNLELPLLNTRLRSKILSNDIKSLGVNTSIKAEYPLQFLRFSIRELIFFILGKHSFSTLWFNKNILFMSNKSLLNKLDFNFISLLKKKFVNFSIYCYSLFCNSEGSNLLGFSTINLKECFFSKSVFGLSLDDSFFIRKLIPLFSTFFWVNKYPTDILKNLSKKSWLPLDINQESGYFLNLEQRIQKMNFIYNSFKYTLNNFLVYIKNLYKFKGYNFKFTNFKKDIHVFSTSTILLFKFLFESFIFPNKLKKNKLLFLDIKFFFSFVLLPFKLILEDPNRSSLQLKFVIPLIKNTQLLKKVDSNYYL